MHLASASQAFYKCFFSIYYILGVLPHHTKHFEMTLQIKMEFVCYDLYPMQKEYVVTA